MKRILINVGLFQAGWFTCVLAGANGLPLVATLTALLVVAFHLFTTYDHRKEGLLLLIAGVIGAGWESVLVAAGWLQYPSGTFLQGMAPAWIIAMWLLFATTLNVSMRWLKGRVLLASLLGAVAGPAAFYTGHRLGGVEFSDTGVAMLVLAIGWAILMPLLMGISNRVDGTRPQLSPQFLNGGHARA